MSQAANTTYTATKELNKQLITIFVKVVVLVVVSM